jgi:hypothetical protein
VSRFQSLAAFAAPNEIKRKTQYAICTTICTVARQFLCQGAEQEALARETIESVKKSEGGVVLRLAKSGAMIDQTSFK